MKLLLTLFVALIIILAGGFFYMTRPKDLGVKYTDADLQSIYGKIKVKYEPLAKEFKDGKTLIVAGSHPVDTTFTSQELTAITDNRYKNYVYFPFRNVQIRVNQDGTVEGSVTNNESTITILSAIIANIPVPGGLVNEYGPQVNDLVEKVIKDRRSSYDVQKLEAKDGKVVFKGNSPDVEMAVKGN